MVRRKAVGVGKQLSPTAYQPQPSHGGCFCAPSQQQPLLVSSMPEYWQNMCSQLSRALPRMAVLVPPGMRSRRVSRKRGVGRVQGGNVRQQQLQSQIRHLPRQQAYRPAWPQGTLPATAKCRPMEYLAWGHCQRNRTMAQQCRNFDECPCSNREAPVCDFESEASLFAETASRIEMQQKGLHEKQLQLQRLQECHFPPQPSESPEGDHFSDSEFHTKNTKRVIHGRVLAPNTPTPLAAPSQRKQEQQRQQQDPQGYQREHPDQQQSSCNFNFGKFASNFIDNWEAHKSKKSPKKCSSTGSAELQRPPEYPKRDRSEPETCKWKRRRSPQTLSDYQVEPLDRGSNATLIAGMSRTPQPYVCNTRQCMESVRNPTPSTEDFRQSNVLPKSPHQSLTSLGAEQEESPLRESCSLMDLHERTFDQAPHQKKPDSKCKMSRIRKVNINQLLQNSEHLDGNAVWKSLVQLVDQMCEPLEDEQTPQKKGTSAKRRLIAGFGSDRCQNKKRKKYSVYLMVNTDVDDEDESLLKQVAESADILAESQKHNELSYERHHNPDFDERQIPKRPEIMQDNYASQCYKIFKEEEQCKRSQPKRKRRTGGRIKELTYPYPILPPGQALRRPLHWPKPDPSKPQTRQQRPLRSISKPPAKKGLQRTIQRQRERVPLAQNLGCMPYAMNVKKNQRYY